jgi:hypothetical protein
VQNLEQICDICKEHLKPKVFGGEPQGKPSNQRIGNKPILSCFGVSVFPSSLVWLPHPSEFNQSTASRAWQVKTGHNMVER